MIKERVGGQSDVIAPNQTIALSHILGKGGSSLKVFTVVQDGGVWRWRVSYPHIGKSACVSTEAFETRPDAERAAHRVAACERPSVTMLEAWQDEYNGYVGSEYSEEHVGV